MARKSTRTGDPSPASDSPNDVSAPPAPRKPRGIAAADGAAPAPTPSPSAAEAAPAVKKAAPRRRTAQTAETETEANADAASAVTKPAAKPKAPPKPKAATATSRKLAAPAKGRASAKKTEAAASSADAHDAPAESQRTGPGTPSGRGKILVIVESPKKARTISKFLGSGYIVEASYGHVRDLPEKSGKGLGIDVQHGYAPTYVVLKDKIATVAKLKREGQKARKVLLATDPDREGEAIAWHLQHAMELSNDQIERVRFFEITERAVRNALQNSTPIDLDKVNAQQTRRFLDRIVGYPLSKLLRNKISGKLSAGRVQSVAVRLIVDREKEIRAFVSEEYWEITAKLSPQAGADADTNNAFPAKLTEWNGKKFAANNEADAQTIHDILAKLPYSVRDAAEEDKKDRADPPFKTSTLQQQAAIRLKFSGKRTMKIAQELYEGIDVKGDGPIGLITYMRTDSLRVSEESLVAVRDLIRSQYGPSYLPDKPIQYAAGKLAQEAHEAIRPTEVSFTPESIRDRLSPDQFKLYQLIYKRFVASQMNPAIFAVTSVVVAAGADNPKDPASPAQGVFKAGGKVLKFDGYRRVLAPAGKQEDNLLPRLTPAQLLDLLELNPSQHFTQPPPRYTEPTLIKALEKENIGRPSTYADIINKIQTRLYVEHKDRKFFATNLGMVVTDMLVENFPKIMDLKFTSHMEDELDQIANAEMDMVHVLDEFYHPFMATLKEAETKIGKIQILTDEKCPTCDAPMVEKFNKAGRFLGCSRYPECKSTKTIDGRVKSAAVETEHKCPKCQRPLLMREGKRGQFLSCSGYPECKESFNLDEQGNPVPSKKETEYNCTKCGKPMLLRQGPRGPFLGCSGYPKCRQTTPLDGEGKPVVQVQIDVKCAKCGGPMGIKSSRRGPFLGCLDYPRCKSTATIPEELKTKHPELFVAPPSASGPDLKSIAITEVCEKCGSAMSVRRGPRGYFLGCTAYPKCKGTAQPTPETLEKINAVVEAAPAAT